MIEEILRFEYRSDFIEVSCNAHWYLVRVRSPIYSMTMTENGSTTSWDDKLPVVRSKMKMLILDWNGDGQCDMFVWKKLIILTSEYMLDLNIYKGDKISAFTCPSSMRHFSLLHN